jgi:putative transposase
MPHIPQRWDRAHQWYFVTVVTLRRQPVFSHASACKVLQSAFHKTYPHYPFRLAALVILPDHWHAMIRPGIRQETSGHRAVVIEQVVGAVKKNVLQDIQRNGPTIWQPRFLDHRIRDEKDFLNQLEYIRLNPIKHGYALEPDRYTWCFIHPSPSGGR